MRRWSGFVPAFVLCVTGCARPLLPTTAPYAPSAPDRAYLLAAAAPPTAADQILLYAGRSSRPNDAIALVRACAFFAAPVKTLREQAAAVGADAIVEFGSFSVDAQCVSGIAVRFRR